MIYAVQAQTMEFDESVVMEAVVEAECETEAVFISVKRFCRLLDEGVFQRLEFLSCSEVVKKTV